VIRKLRCRRPVRCARGRLTRASILLAALALASHGIGGGLTGEYFDNADFTARKLVRVDATVDFAWGQGSPDPALGAETFAVRWSGQVEPLYSGTYTFYVTADDGARLWVDERLLAARAISGSGTVEISGSTFLRAGQRYNLVLEFEEHSGPALVRLEWASASQPREIIPEARLHPTTALPQTGSLLMEFWSNVAGGALPALTNDARFPDRPNGRECLTSFECPVTNLADHYGTRVSGFLAPPVSGPYRLAVSAADTALLFLAADTNPASRQLVASVPAATGFRDFTRFTNQLSPPTWLASTQRYYVELLHGADAGDDHFSVAWQPPGQTNLSVIPADALVPAGLDRAPPAQAQILATLPQGHPRLLASEARFAWLRQTLDNGSAPQLTSWWTSLRSAANTLLGQPPNTYNPDGRGTILSVSRSVLDRVGKLALAYRLTGDTNYAERAWTELEAAANFPDWDPAHFLDTAEMTHAFALGYDWLHAYWSAARRSALTNAIIVKGLKPGLDSYRNNAWFFRSTANNWNLVCNGGMALGALALADEAPELAAEILARAIASAAPVMRHWTADHGGWYEGPGYWNYTTEYNSRLLAGLQSALGSDFGLSSTPGFSEAGLAATHWVGPTGLSFNFADASAGQMRGAHLFWLARRYNRPAYAWHERTYGSATPMDLLWYDPRGVSPLDAGLPAAQWFRGPTASTAFHPADVVCLRTDWASTTASFAALKTGQIGDSHGHLDAGGFVFDALGVRWAHDLGGDDYALPGYFGSQRWTYYRLRAEGHNTLVVNPGQAADQVVGAKPPILLFQDHPREAAVVADLTSAYGLTRVWRGLRLFQGRRWLLVQDEIQAASPATVWWFMHFNTAATATVSSDGSAAVLTQGTARLWVKVLAGGGTLAVSNAVPLPSSPNPAGQNANASFRKLTIKLSNVTNTRLAVLLVPLRPGEQPPATLPALQPLDQWPAQPTSTWAVAGSTTLAAWDQTPAEVDLRSLVRDPDTLAATPAFAVLSASNGTAGLLPDGHTARFTPAAAFRGLTSFEYALTIPVPPTNTLFYYDFEPPEDAADGAITDRGTRWLDGTLSQVGSGSCTLSSNTPAALAGASRQSLRLVDNGDGNSARLVGPRAPGDYDFNRRDWTFSGWLNRATTTNDDFVFYLGNSDGFGSPDELQLYCPSGVNSVVLRHYTGPNSLDADLACAGVSAGQWRHVAVVFDSTHDNQGTLALYVDGVRQGFDGAVTLNTPSTAWVVLGGHASTTFATRRWFNGWLDDLAVFSAALDEAQIAQLAALPVGRLGSLCETGRVQVLVNHRNQPPRLTPLPNTTVVAGQTLTLTNAAFDPDLDGAPLGFTLLSGPDGASLFHTTGVLTWRPTLADAGRSHVFTIRVADTGSVAILPPVADAYIEAGLPGENFGCAPVLKVANQGGAAPQTNEAFLRFDLRGVAGDITRARLRLTPSVVSSASTHTLQFVPADDWDERMITAAVAPVATNLLASWTPLAGTPIEVQVTAAARQEIAGDGQLSLRLQATQAAGVNATDYPSREAGTADFPQLVLHLAALSATQACTVTVLPPQPPLLSVAGIAEGQLNLTVAGDVGPDYRLLASSNLATWELVLTTNPVDLPLRLRVPVRADHPQQFYRVVLGP